MNTNLNQTTETAKTLRLNTTVTVLDTVELEIALPYFCKHPDGAYYKVISESNTLRVLYTEYPLLTPLVLVMMGTTQGWRQDIAKSVQVSETEFQLAVSLALNHLQKAAA